MSSRKVKGSAAVFWRFTTSPVTSASAGGRSPPGQGDAMLFGRKPKPPLALAIGMVSDAMEVAYAYLRDDKHMDTDEDVEMLDILAVLLTMNGEIANFILKRKQKRSKERSKGG